MHVELDQLFISELHLESAVTDKDIQRVVDSCHDAPQTILGPHFCTEDSTLVIRTFLPFADTVTVREVRNGRTDFAMDKVHEDGLFEAIIPEVDESFDYELVAIDADGKEHCFYDPYAIKDTLFTESDADKFASGQHSRLYEKLGAHPLTRETKDGVNFAVWAPAAQRVSVVGNFNRWDGRCHQMQRLGASGIWEVFIPDIAPGEFYKYEIKTPNGHTFLKADPFAILTEALPKTAAIIHSSEPTYIWRDSSWLKRRKSKTFRSRPISIYPLNLEALFNEQRESSKQVNYASLCTAEFIESIEKGGYTHVELYWSIPGVMAGSSFLAPDMRFGTPDELRTLVDIFHYQGFGVILPGLGAHFSHLVDELVFFDGTPLYESPAAPTTHFNLEKPELRSIFLSTARFWLERYHADGISTDADAALIYHDLIQKEHRAWAGTIIASTGSHHAAQLSHSDLQQIIEARHSNPYSVLGPHSADVIDGITVRALVPRATHIYLRFTDRLEILYRMERLHDKGLFHVSIPAVSGGDHYRFNIIESGGQAFMMEDPYAITSFIYTDFDQHLYGQGNHYAIYTKLGAHPREVNGVNGASFAVWAPNADGMSVVGPFNEWDGRRHQMVRHGISGVWEIFVPEVRQGDLYKFEIRARNGHIFVKSDPFAFSTEAPPDTASVFYDLFSAYRWEDKAWMDQRRQSNAWHKPVSIYEVHLGSWKRKEDGSPLTYRELAKELIPYVKEMGFTHIELLPIAEHPFEPSWGYQVSNFYAPTARFGKPKDLMYLIDTCHQAGVGVILDWVAGHFPRDAHALAWFDGTGLYEHADPRQGEHRDWGTLIFNYGRHEVENFLIANALFWLEVYHFDGLRVDAVASMLYLDYSRGFSGEWIPNQYGGNENLEAIEFLKHTNAVVHEKFPNLMMIAEESTAWPKVSRPTDEGGLGFGFKWNMGWMHDVLFYLSHHPDERKHHHHSLTFSIVYAFSENFILSLSHDEVVHMKGSLINKMPGTEWEQFANLRLLYTFMYTHPGKKLIFMGGEFAQRNEWNHAATLQWDLLEHEPHRKLQHFVKDLNGLYQSERSLHEQDFNERGFEWMDVNHAEDSVVAFVRRAKDPREALLCVFNFSLISRPQYRLGIPYPVAFTPILNSNASCYGGASGRITDEKVFAEELPWEGQMFSIKLSLPALSAQVLKPAPPDP
jgi:1,4-alpha-glucan branching enzyme